MTDVVETEGAPIDVNPEGGPTTIVEQQTITQTDVEATQPVVTVGSGGAPGGNVVRNVEPAGEDMFDPKKTAEPEPLITPVATPDQKPSGGGLFGGIKKLFGK